MDEIKWLTELGSTGVLAGFIFYFYRQDRLNSEKALAKIVDDYRLVIEHNTEAWERLMEKWGAR